MSEMISFDDYGKDTPFTFKGVVYLVPAITNEKAMELFNMGKSKSKKEDKTLFDSADLQEEEVEVEDEDTDFNYNFINSAIVKEDGTAFTREEFNKWPMRVTLKVMRLINDCISTIDEDSPKEKK